MKTESIEAFQPKTSTSLATGDALSQRAIQEVQASYVIAKRFPRDIVAACHRITTACRRQALAEVACYAYPRGGTTVTGPSIRLAEAIAQCYGNIEFGIVELEQRDGESTVLSFAVDLESNTRQTKVFTVPHYRKARGDNVRLTDPRDIYELVANQGARRLRTCILGIIPGDIVENAVTECERTLKTGSKEPLIDRIKKMVTAFHEHGVSQGMLEARIGHKIEALTEQEIVNLKKIYTSLRDGAANREDFFKLSQDPQRESDDGDLGPAANPASTQAPAPTVVSDPPIDPQTPQEQLAVVVFAAGFGFTHFQKWAADTGNVPDADSLPDFDALDTTTAKRLLKAKVGLLKGLAEVKEGGV